MILSNLIGIIQMINIEQVIKKVILIKKDKLVTLGINGNRLIWGGINWNIQ
jgi:hypothetical protein